MKEELRGGERKEEEMNGVEKKEKGYKWRREEMDDVEGRKGREKTSRGGEMKEGIRGGEGKEEETGRSCMKRKGRWRGKVRDGGN